MAQDYVDFTNDILRKYSFFKDGSFVKLFIKRIKVNYVIQKFGINKTEKNFIPILKGCPKRGGGALEKI